MLSPPQTAVIIVGGYRGRWTKPGGGMMGCVGRSPVEVDELVEHWTVLEDEQQLVAGKRGATRLGFALLLKFYTRSGRFPRGRSELPQEAVEFVARQMQVPAGDLRFYEWSGSTLEYHRAQIRMLACCRGERLEPPAGSRIDRVVRSALRLGEETLTPRVSARLTPAVTKALQALVVAGTPRRPGRRWGGQ